MATEEWDTCTNPAWMMDAVGWGSIGCLISKNQARSWVKACREAAFGPDIKRSLFADLSREEELNWAVDCWSKSEGNLTWNMRADLLREVVGNPFRPVRFTLGWLTRDALSLASMAYQEWAVLPILADALEDAGCTGELLSHLRSPGLHVRGCWAVELLLGQGVPTPRDAAFLPDTSSERRPSFPRHGATKR